MSLNSQNCCIFAAKKPQKIEIMEATARTLDNDKTHFATLAIGATAKEMGITETELYNRLDRVGLIDSLIFGCYDTLHTESISGVVWNVTEALKNWETKKGILR